MNLNRTPTVQQLARLVAPLDDLAGAHLLWVTKNGDVKITRMAGDSALAEFQHAHPEMQLCCEPFQAGNEYVGPEAAKDKEWLADLLDRLLKQWREAQGKVDVAYLALT